MLGNLRCKRNQKIEPQWIRRNNQVFILVLIILYLLYVLTRSIQGGVVDVLLFIFGWYLTYIYLKTPVGALIKRNIKVVLAVVCLYIFAHNLAYFRYSRDGLVGYFRNVVNVEHLGISTRVEGSQYPYLVELLMGLASRIFPLNTLFISFGLAGVLCAYTSWLIYGRLGLSGFVKRAALMVFISSPTFLFLLFYEFKIELFLLLFTNLYTLLWLKVFDNASHRNFAVLGLLSSITFLIKVSSLPLFVVCTAGLIVFLFRKNILTWGRCLKMWTVYLVFLLLPVVGWLLYTPTYLPLFGDIDLLKKNNPLDFAGLDRDSEIWDMCIRQARFADYSSFIYYKNELSLLLQPFQYLLLKDVTSYQFSFHFINPGPYIYFGIWLIGVALHTAWRRRLVHLTLLLGLSIPFILVIYIQTKSVFWYLFPVFPLLSLVVPYIAENILTRDKFKNIFLWLLLSLSFAQLFWGFATSLQMLAYRRESVNVLNELREMNARVQELATDSFVMNATQHQHAAYFPFMTNSRERLVESDYYFASSEKDLEGMRDELVGKNVHYVVAMKDTLFDPWYKGCPLRNNERLFNFLEQHTILVADYGQFGEVYQII